jgi:hypothetical protein
MSAKPKFTPIDKAKENHKIFKRPLIGHEKPRRIGERGDKYRVELNRDAPRDLKHLKKGRLADIDFILDDILRNGTPYYIYIKCGDELRTLYMYRAERTW